MKPTIGRIVRYRPSPQDPPGVLHNDPEFLPAIVTRVYPDPESGVVNLKVFCDGPGIVHLNDVGEGDEPGKWQWPRREVW